MRKLPLFFGSPLVCHQDRNSVAVLLKRTLYTLSSGSSSINGASCQLKFVTRLLIQKLGLVWFDVEQQSCALLGNGQRLRPP
ncbi:hypothetical protein Bca4012_100374 [Brassica carinata]